MAKLSAGILVYRIGDGDVAEVLLVHPGGPFWARKDDAAWSVPKGEHDEDENAMEVARREFREELGQEPPKGDLVDLGSIRQPSGKHIQIWAVQGTLNVDHIISNTFELEWPRGSGKTQHFPEVDRAGWFSLAMARKKLHKGQVPFVEHLIDMLEKLDLKFTEGTTQPEEKSPPTLF